MEVGTSARRSVPVHATREPMITTWICRLLLAPVEVQVRVCITLTNMDSIPVLSAASQIEPVV